MRRRNFIEYSAALILQLTLPAGVSVGHFRRFIQANKLAKFRARRWHFTDKRRRQIIATADGAVHVAGHIELMPKKQVFDFKLAPRLEQIRGKGHEQTKDRKHPVE